MKRIILILAVLATSCTNQRKVLRYLSEHPGVGAEYCAKAYPVEPTKYIKGDTVVRHDTTYRTDSVPCPPVPGQKVVFVKCPPNQTITRTVTRTDTLMLQDNAKLAVVEAKGRVLTDSLIIYKERFKEAKETASKRGWTVVWLSVVLALVVGWSVAKFFKVF